jgi:murein DD-endopeptidase MepM/ murein hydrolase activator NlpD
MLELIMPTQYVVVLASTPARTAGPVRRSQSTASYQRVPSAAMRQALASARTPNPPARTMHTVRSGDSLSRVVRRHLEAQGQRPSAVEVARHVDQVSRANGIANPNLIFPGQEIDVSSLYPSRPAPVVPAPRTTRLERTPHVENREPINRPRAVNGQGGAARPTTDLSELVRSILEGRAPSSVADAPAEKHALIQGDKPWSRLVRGEHRLSSNYGMRTDPFSGKPAFHEGLDIAAPSGTPIHPFRAGKVSFSGWKPGYGKAVVVRHAGGLESIYGHAGSVSAKVGDRVSQHTELGKVGSTGRSTGPHLHFEVRRKGKVVNPTSYLKQYPPPQQLRG